MNVTLSDYPVRLVLSSTRNRNGAANVVHNSVHDTYRYLQAQARRPGVVVELRELMNKLGPKPLSPGDDVLHAVAAGLVQEQLFLLQVQADSGSGSIEDIVALPLVADKRPTVSPPAPLPPPAKPLPVERPRAEAEPTALLQQDLQAQTLEAAAASGKPFCAICERDPAAPGGGDAAT